MGRQVLENVTGLSGTYVRFQAANAGISQERFYKQGFQDKSRSAEQRYARTFTLAAISSQVQGGLYPVWFTSNPYCSLFIFFAEQKPLWRYGFGSSYSSDQKFCKNINFLTQVHTGNADN